jgi:hypothetical protein
MIADGFRLPAWLKEELPIAEQVVARLRLGDPSDDNPCRSWRYGRATRRQCAGNVKRRSGDVY